MTKKALFAISSLWLWHATRTLPIIKKYLEKGFKIDIVSFWNALNYLKNDLKENVNFYEFEDYPALERWDWISYYYFLIQDTLKTHSLIKKEQDFIESLQGKNNYDFIFSDWRYWSYSKKTKCYILSHQLSFDIPKFFWFSQKFMDNYNKKVFQKFDMLFIPDYEDKKDNLAWKLSHPDRIWEVNHCYIWILSSFFDAEKKQSDEIDFLVTVSGYLTERKDFFISEIKNNLKKMPGKKVFILWNTKEFKEEKHWEDLQIYSFLSGEKRNEIFLKSKNIVSRAGYTTIMDLIELDKKAILYPTPNQTEQEYLAEYLSKKNIFLVWKDASDIKNLVNFKQTKNIFKTKTKDALEKILKIINL